MDVLFKPGNRVLAAAAVVALLVVLFPCWYAIVQGVSFGMSGGSLRQSYRTEFLGWGPLWAPPQSSSPICATSELACFSFVSWIIVAAELAAVAALAGVAWLIDRPRNATRARLHPRRLV